MSQPNQPTRTSSIPISISIGLVFITILSLALVGYTALNPHLSTVTQQQFVTDTQNIYGTQTQTQTVTLIGTQTVTAVITSTTGFGYGPGYQGCTYYGSYYCSYPGYSNYYPRYNSNYYACQSSTNSTAQCSGYLYRSTWGCTELAIPINNGYYYQSGVYQYYTLQNLPSTYPSLGSWVTVTGQIYNGYNTGTYGTACPGSYITVTTISP